MKLLSSAIITAAVAGATLVAASPAMASTQVGYEHCTWTVENANGSGGLAMRTGPGTGYRLIVRVKDGQKVQGADKPYKGSGLTWFDVVWVNGSGHEDIGYMADSNGAGTSYLKVDTCVPA